MGVLVNIEKGLKEVDVSLGDLRLRGSLVVVVVCGVWLIVWCVSSCVFVVWFVMVVVVMVV